MNECSTRLISHEIIDTHLQKTFPFGITLTQNNSKHKQRYKYEFKNSTQGNE